MFRVAMFARDTLCVVALLGAGVASAADASRSTGSCLLQTASHLDREGRLASRAATLPGPLRLPGLLKAAMERDPGSPGHFLTKAELDPVSSIACLKAKQQDPAVNCTDGISGISSAYSGWSGELNAGNFPSYKDAACHSDGALLCDPQQVLKMDERATVAAELSKSRDTSPVTCGRLLGRMPGQLHNQPFYLGVVIIKNWDLSHSQPEYLQQLGEILTAQWDMNEVYVGSTIPYGRCPSTGVLIILPETDQAFLSTPSCEFICQSSGGDEVVAATLAALRNAGPSEAALAGIREVYKFLADKPQASAQRDQNVSAANVDTKEIPGTWVINAQRTIFVLTCLLLVGSSVVGGFLLWLGPGFFGRQRAK